MEGSDENKSRDAIKAETGLAGAVALLLSPPRPRPSRQPLGPAPLAASGKLGRRPGGPT